jgi:hypothetical protein
MVDGVSDWHSPKACVPRCLYCGIIGVWWECGCEWAERVRAGKVRRPRVRLLADGVVVIELDGETVGRNPLGMRLAGEV